MSVRVVQIFVVIGILMTGLIQSGQANPETDYVVIYKKITSATQHQKQGRSDRSRQLFKESLQEIKDFQKQHRSWNPGIINYRINYIQDRLAELGPGADSSAQTASSNRLNQPASDNPDTRRQQMSDQLAADQQILNHLKSRVELLESEKSKLQDKLREALTANPDQIDPKQIETARQKIRELTIENQLLQVQLAESVKKAAEIEPADNLEKSIKDLSDQITVLNLEKKGLNLEIERLKANRQESTDSPEILEIPDSDPSIRQLESIVADLENKLRESSAELLTKSRRESQIEKQLTSIMEVNDSLKSDNSQLLRQINQMRNQLGSLDNLDHYKNHIAALEADLAAKDLEIARLTEENKRLTENNEKLQSEIRQLATTNRELEDLLAVKDKQILDVSKEMDQAALNFQNEINQLKSRNQDLENSLTTSLDGQNQLADMNESRYAQIQREVADLKAANSRLKDENLVLREWLSRASPSGSQEFNPTTAPKLAVFNNDQPPMDPVGTEDFSGNNGIAGTPTENVETIQPTTRQRLEKILLIEKELTDKLDANPKDLETRNRFSALLMERSEFARARRFVDETISLYPSESEPLVLKALLERQERDFKSAVKALEQAIKLDSSNPNAHMLLGTILSELGHRKAAEESLRRAVRLDPENPVAHFNLCVAYLYQDPPYRALAQFHYNEAVRLGHPKDSDVEIRIQKIQ